MWCSNVDAIRAHFPALRDGAAHFDGPGGSQTPDVVADAIRSAMLSPLANRGVTTVAERNAEEIVGQCRRALGDLLNADPDGVIFGRSMTSLTFDLSRTLSATWRAGDEIVVSRLDHDANVRPWVIAAERAGAVVRWADFDPATGELPAANVEAVLSARTRLVAITAASNLIGTMPDVKRHRGAHPRRRCAALRRRRALHGAPRGRRRRPGCRFLSPARPTSFSGPHCGVVAGRPELLEELHPDKLLPSTDRIPERFELGTLPYELMAGTTAAVEFLAGMAGEGGDRRATAGGEHGRPGARHEDDLRDTIEAGLRRLPGATLYSRAERRTPTLLTTFAGHDPGRDQRISRRSRRQRPRRDVLRVRACPAPRARRRGRRPNRLGALQQRRRRRPAARGFGRLLRPAFDRLIVSPSPPRRPAGSVAIGRAGHPPRG